MDLYKDMTLSGGPCGATTYNPSPLLALHDFIGQNAAPISSYAYSMSVLREEDEEEQYEQPSFHNELPPPQDNNEVNNHNPYQEGRPEEEPIPPNHQDEDEAQPNGGRPSPDATTRPQPTHWKTAPQTTTKRPNWQTIRFQSLPGKHGDKTQLEAWIGGWSAAVGELGDETYCACADSTVVAPIGGECSSITSEQGKRKKEWLSECRGSDDTQTDRGRRREQEEEQIPRPISFALCRTCSRQPSPAIVPDQEFSFGPTSGTGKIALRCRVVWRSIVGRLVGRQQQRSDVVRHGEREGPGLKNSTAVSQTQQRDYGYDEEGDDDDEVDVDKLSRSSGEGGQIRRAGDAIAEKRARLRRAQRLLSKGSRGFSEPG
jgi:hypothetical protein